jgi:small subunit ribosomal protein S16
MLMIRFVRVGRKNQAYFHLVVAEKARAVQKKIIEKLGHLSPHVNKGEGEFIFDADRIKHYISNGAQMSQTAARILTKNGFKEAGAFVVARATKPKRTPAPTEAPVTEETPAEEVAETSVEETTKSPTEESEKEVTDKEEKTEEAPAETEAPAEEEKKDEEVKEGEPKEETPEETKEEEKAE